MTQLKRNEVIGGGVFVAIVITQFWVIPQK